MQVVTARTLSGLSLRGHMILEFDSVRVSRQRTVSLQAVFSPESFVSSCKARPRFFGFLVAGGGNQRALGDILFVSVASEDRRRTCPAEESPSSTGQGAG